MTIFNLRVWQAKKVKSVMEEPLPEILTGGKTSMYLRSPVPSLDNLALQRKISTIR